MIVRSRRGSSQIRQMSASETLPQIVQNLTSFLTRMRTAASRSTSVSSAASRWNAMRWALFGPTPGSRPSSSMRSWTAPSYIDGLQTRQAETAEAITEPAHATRDRAHLLGRELADGAVRVAHGGDDQVLQGLHVVGVDRLRVDGQRSQLAAAGERGGDQPAARGAGDLGRRQLGLRRGELLLHLLSLLEQLLHVRLSAAAELPATLCHWIASLFRVVRRVPACPEL